MWQGLANWLANEWREQARVNQSDRPWEMPVAAALSGTRLSHRMAWLMACAFGMTASHALGMVGHFHPPLVVPLSALIAILVTMV